MSCGGFGTDTGRSKPMAETHLLMNVAALVGALWWTQRWLMQPMVARWRFAISALAGTILWVFVAYSSTRVVDPSGGVGHVFESFALAWFAAFMAFVSVIGLIMGLFLWTEEEAERTAETLPEGIRTQFGD